MVIRFMATATHNLPDDPAFLKAMIAALQAENAKMSATLQAHDQLIQSLRLRIARLKKQVFGKSSEKIEREIQQLELALEDLLIAAAESNAGPINEADQAAPVAAVADSSQRIMRRRPRVSEKATRERRELDPGTCCPACGGELRLVGEDVSEILDMIAAQMKVIEVARLKKSCRCCEKMVQLPAPSRPIPGSMAGASILAYILVSKFDDHLPLYRLNEIFARMGADIPDSTLVDWCGRAMKVLQPLIERIERAIMTSDLLHADDTPIRVLDRSMRDKGLGKGVKKGRIWTYVRDQRPWAGAAPPGAVYYFAPDWKEEHVHRHLRQASGILQADGYKGYGKLYEPGADGTSRFQEAACWAHWRRDFHDIWSSNVNDRLRHGPQEGKCVDMAVHPCLGHSSRISPDIAGVAVGQIEHEKLLLLFHPADDNYSLPKVRLAMPGRMGQRHKHFLTAPLPLAHVVLDDRVAAGKSMFITQPVKYPLGRMALLAR